MIRVIAIRLLRLVAVLGLVSLGTFFLIELVPGDPAIAALGENATPERIKQAHTEMGLDRPVGERYVEWLGDAVRGDLGHSLLSPARSVGSIILQSLPITAQIALMALAMALAMAIPAALVAAAKPEGLFDRALMLVTSAVISVPTFLAALLLAFFFVFHQDVPRGLLLGLAALGAIGLLRNAWRARDSGAIAIGRVVAAAAVVACGYAAWRFFPSFDRTGFVRLTDDAGIQENLRSAFLPAFTLALAEAAVFSRLLRADLLATLQDDFILAARATGIPSWRIMLVHALRPSSFSLITVAGISLGRLIGGTVIVETVFGISGMGRLIVENVIDNDYTIVQGAVLVVAVFYVLINYAVDGLYLLLDPRLRNRD